jgi:F-type H+-transporting ATPase subunit alpha
LARGGRIVELLKQSQYSPFPVEDQVVSIWCGTSGELDEVPVEDVRRFESEFLDYLKSAHPEIPRSIAATNEKLPDETIGLLRSAIDAFKNTFERGDGTLLRGDVAVGALDPSEVGQETITRHTRS